MTLAPLVAAPLAIQLHTAAATVALLAGAAVLVLPKGRGFHRPVGTLAALALLVTAVSSFWIFGIFPGRPSPIHLLSILTIVSVIGGVIARRRGNIRRHKLSMIGVYVGLIGAGIFTLLPGRMMNLVVFGG